MLNGEGSTPLDCLHHVAISVHRIDESVKWYRENFRCDVAYQDDTWAMLRFANVNLALVLPGQHPPHLGFVHPEAARFGTLKGHRDGTASVYISDPSNNVIELLEANEPALSTLPFRPAE